MQSTNDCDNQKQQFGLMKLLLNYQFEYVLNIFVKDMYFVAKFDANHGRALSVYLEQLYTQLINNGTEIGENIMLKFYKVFILEAFSKVLCSDQDRDYDAAKSHLDNIKACLTRMERTFHRGNNITLVRQLMEIVQGLEKDRSLCSFFSNGLLPQQVHERVVKAVTADDKTSSSSSLMYRLANEVCSDFNDGDKTEQHYLKHFSQTKPKDSTKMSELEITNSFDKEQSSILLEKSTSSFPHVKRRSARINNMFRCSQCQQSFLFKFELLFHERSHNVKLAASLDCHICSVKVPYHSRLKYHLVSHTGERAFKCKLCSKTFLYKHQLLRHIRFIHPTKEKKKPFLQKHLLRRKPPQLNLSH